MTEAAPIDVEGDIKEIEEYNLTGILNLHLSKDAVGEVFELDPPIKSMRLLLLLQHLGLQIDIDETNNTIVSVTKLKPPLTEAQLRLKYQQSRYDSGK